MKLKEIINKSVYCTDGYISSKETLNTLEQYILYNLQILKEFKHIIIATNYKSYPDLVDENNKLWKKYFPECILIDLKINRGHSFGTADLDNALFNYCKENQIDWICKSDNDIIIQDQILDKEVDEADFYYLNGIGYGGMVKYNFDLDIIMNEDFYPQTGFYFMDVSKIDYLNDENHVNEIYNKIQNISDYNNKAWEYGFKSCELLLKECVERNNLSKYHLISQEKYNILLNVIKDNNIHDPSHKNIMIEGICHFQYPTQQVIEIN
jgi:hypothetical protein